MSTRLKIPSSLTARAMYFENNENNENTFFLNTKKCHFYSDILCYVYDYKNVITLMSLINVHARLLGTWLHLMLRKSPEED